MPTGRPPYRRPYEYWECYRVTCETIHRGDGPDPKQSLDSRHLRKTHSEEWLYKVSIPLTSSVVGGTSFRLTERIK